VYSKYYLENLKGRDQLKDVDVDGRIITKIMLNKQVMGIWTGFSCLRIGFNNGIL
jgi:hypothetical protein